MKIGLIGLPQAGKKTLFELLTGHRPSEKELASGRPIKGVAEVRDGRFDRLVEIYRPKKEARARIDIEVLPRLEKEAIVKGDIFADIDSLDALCHIVRAFRDDSVYHASGSVDPRRDIASVEAELILHDLLFIEKRLERLERTIQETKEAPAAKERELLLKLKGHLEKEQPLRLLDLTADERKALSSYPFITRKEMMIVANISEDDLKGSKTLEALERDCRSGKVEMMRVSAKLEAEIAALESAGEREEFMETLGIAEPAINMLTRLLIRTLDLISFFTVGPDEVRQWTIRSGSTAPEAAGAIHSDLMKGFIRAEVIKYDDLLGLGSEERVKSVGKFYLKGKDYIVEDGDILTVRFSV